MIQRLPGNRNEVHQTRPISILLTGCLLGLFLPSCGGSGPQNAKKADYGQLFQNTEMISFIGTEETPLYSAMGPYEGNGRFYFTDYLNHYLLEYDRQAAFLRTVGGKGQGPGEFQMPYGLAIDDDGRVYVNDRGHMRTQVLDRDLDFLNFLDMQAVGDGLMVYRQGDQTYLRYLGLTACSAGSCLVQQRDLETGTDETFAPAPADFMVATWEWTQDPADGSIYLANVAIPEVSVYDAHGTWLRTLSLRAPDWKEIEPSLLRRPVTSAEDLSHNLKMRQTLPYTQVAALGISGPHLLVQLGRKNMSSPGYVLMLLDKHTGDVRHYGMDTPGLLTRVSGTTCNFVQHDRDTDHGAAVLTRATLKVSE